MKRWIKFEEALRKRIIEEYDEVVIKSLYSSENSVDIPPQITGYDEIQTFSREEDLEFFFAYDKNYQPTFYGDTTKTELRLSGKRGSVYGVSAVNLACSPYSNPKRGLFSRATTEEDIIKFSRSFRGEKILFRTRHIGWLGSFYVYTGIESINFGVRSVNYGLVCGEYLYNSNGECNYYMRGVRPAVPVYMPSKILVDKERSSKGKWVLRPTLFSTIS